MSGDDKPKTEQIATLGRVLDILNTMIAPDRRELLVADIASLDAETRAHLQPAIDAALVAADIVDEARLMLASARSAVQARRDWARDTCPKLAAERERDDREYRERQEGLSAARQARTAARQASRLAADAARMAANGVIGDDGDLFYRVEAQP